jgi:hypothetical protein
MIVEKEEIIRHHLQAQVLQVLPVQIITERERC